MMTTTTVPLQVSPEAAPVIYYQQQEKVPSRLNSTAALVTGYMQISLSVVSLAFGVACIFLQYLQGTIAVPIWGALGFYLVAGILGVIAGKSKGRNSCAIVGCLVMSILAAVTACIHLYWGGMSSAYSSSDYYNDNTEYAAVDIVCTLIGGIELVVAITSSVYMCCGATCCCGTSTNTQYASYVVQSGQVSVQGYPMVQVVGQSPVMGQQPVIGQQYVVG
ncbi:uncharacterized protein [Antedon mediterranea]|uniref:uncharacterized protein n=1 Tax=Antedon mediterranea TaxID=105859 RepID=UPI003AF685E5